MANHYAANYTKAYVNVPSSKIPPGEVSGDIKMAYDEINLNGKTIALNDVIKTALKVPAGARIVDAGIFIPASLGATGIFSLGQSSNQDSLVVSADGGGQAALSKATAASADLMTEMTAETLFELLCTEATPAIATDLYIKVWVAWVDV